MSKTAHRGTSEILSKGIILAGGAGTRLYPATRVSCKPLLAIYDKPMIYYPLSTLMLLGITEILLISTPEEMPRFERLFGDGHGLGLNISYASQPTVQGIAQAFLIGEEFIGGSPVALILGDNIFCGPHRHLRDARRAFCRGATVFACCVDNPREFGVVELDRQGKAVGIEEKPETPKSNHAVTGLYLYDAQVVSIARSLRPSARGELEITDVNNVYLRNEQLEVVQLGGDITWLDVGTFENMLEAANVVAGVEKKQGRKTACVEEIAYRMKLIDHRQVQRLLDDMVDGSYRQYLARVVREIDRETR